MFDAVLNDPKLPMHIAMGGTVFVILLIAEVARRFRKEAKRLQALVDEAFNTTGILVGTAETEADPPFMTAEQLHRKYEGMAEKDESPSGGPRMAGKLKYIEQVRWHGKQ